MLAHNSTRYYNNHTDMFATNTTNNYFDEAKFISLLKGGHNTTRNIEEVLRALENWRNRYNISVVKECDRSEYCSGEFRDLILAYNSIHGYVSLLICLFGSLLNALNVAVLTRRDLAAAPINRLLKWLAVTDVFVMIEYVPFAVYRYLLFPGQPERPFVWAVYMLFHMHFTQILHTASIFLTLSLAIWRYIAIKYPSHSASLCSDRRCNIAVLLSFLLPPILCIPSYFVFTIHKDFTFDLEDGKRTPKRVYFVDSDYDGTLYQINFWVHAVVIKLLPCLILTVLSAWLIRALYRANTRKKLLKGYNACPEVVLNGNRKKQSKRSKLEKRTDRTTRMLVAVLLLFLITEFPQGILGLLSGLLGRCFFKRCYDLFGELMDALALMNGAINFVLYCSMSRQFRMNFGAMFRSKCAPTHRAVSQTEIHTTYV